ncbi:hypothetical protein ZYGR_0N02060 [Zygosaccharomyces rouxii]|uniref:RNA-binding protein VTS1 n=2 Tax=Zygosaccharomyces rouxii TaxID=4956 RepID=C5DVA1_ZYGRC|nr:uncharacterized protein ZYRO0D05060g [Zygosaccharomyces rouxii]KAH9200633.1 hypothetical protein LQ764DRAFT_97255 [Zygosaccharomyces rouxii]GAV48801.1 hypothetical protein ZYGR_0N02060 [Zygosaccharomyces rouxii]CAR27720.1 ZYRO0D05060p [Zygosaccharomyces rouxii]
MNHAYDEFGQGSQSPYTVGRGAHPGAVLLSPQSSAMNLSNSIASPMVLSPKMGAQSHSMFFNDVVDVQPLPQPAIPSQSSSTTPAAPATASAVAAAPKQGTQAPQNSHATHNSAAGSAVLSPMVQSPNCNPSNLGSASMFLDSFTRPSSTSMLGANSKPKQQTQQNQHPQSSQQLPPSQTATTAGAASQHLPQSQQPPQQHQQSTVPPPPQLPNNPVVNFTQDINQLCSWLSMLSSAQQNTVMDNLLFTLHEDVLQYTKLKLNSLVKSGFISPQVPAIASPVPNRDPYPLINLDSVFTNDEVDNDPNDNSILFQHWSPQPTSVTQPIFDYIKDVHQRPKSADPHVARATGHAPSNNKPKRNLGVGNNNNNNNNNNNINNNSHANVHSYGHSSSNHHFTSKARAAAASGGDIDSSGSAESLSRPASRGNVQNGSVAINAAHNNNTSIGNNTSNTHSGTNNNNNSTSNSATPTGTTTATNGSSMNPKTLTDPRLLTNIPVWLKSLRLHKYSDSLRSKRWDELIYLDDETLEKMGISALGARRKLLKAFAVVKEYKEQGLIDQSAYV